MSGNALSPAETELLAILAEEMGEAIQAIGKVLRHGYDSVHPDMPNGPTNRENLERELGHVRNAMLMLCDAHDLSKDIIHAHAQVKRQEIQQYLHHQTI